MKMRVKKVLPAFFAAVVMLMTTANTAFAVELTQSNTDKAGNYYSAGEVVNTRDDSASLIENECFMAGQTVYLEDVAVDGSAFLAGSTVNIKDSMVGSSIFAAGSDISVDGSANNNIWLAGANINISDETSVKGIHVVGANVNVDGTYNQVDVCGGNVVFNAKVDGDVNIEAESVTIGKDADVTGNINITYSENYDETDGASVPNLNVTKVETEKDDSAKTAAKTFGGILAGKVKSAFFLIFSNSIIALILALLFGSSLKKAYVYCTTKTGMFIGFGALVACLGPAAILLVLITFIGAPTAGIALMIYATVGFGCKVFTFGSLIRELIFSHTKKRLHPVLETVLAVLPLAIVRQIPFINGIIAFACMIYVWGYIVLAMAERLSAEKQ